MVGEAQALQCQTVYMCTSVLFNFSNLPNHINVQPHTLYKIDRYRVELHRKVHALVEASSE